MLRVDVLNEPLERWEPVIRHHFSMTLAPRRHAIRSLSVALVAPRPGDPAATYTCELQGRAASGVELRITSRHEVGDVVIAHVFARARRELSREHLRSRVLS